MFFEIYYVMYLVLFAVIVWVVGWPLMMIYDYFKGNRFRPFYRLIWPLLVISELAH